MGSLGDAAARGRLAVCDTFVVPGVVTLFGKNSDREPGEAQAVERRAAGRHPPGARLRATHIELGQAARTHEVVLSRPAWMWGAEIGVNARGLAVGNEAIFTRVPVARRGLTGMDLVRLALERTAGAREALELVAWMLARHGQGGECGHRRSFRYHNAFLFADPGEAWVMETAGPHWVAQRVRGARTISNAPSIGRDFDLASPDVHAAARALGTLRRGQDLDFRRCFADPVLARLSGAAARAACTARALAGAAPSLALAVAALRDHAGRDPRDGLVMTMPCAHASFLPTRTHGQTTGSLVARLGDGPPRVLATGTSSPCLSVFKPVPLGDGEVDTGPAPAADRADADSLFWRHERLHRAVHRDPAARGGVSAAERAALEREAFAATTAAAASAVWQEHRARVPGWWQAATRAPARPRRLVDLWWALQSRRDGLRAEPST